MKYIYLILLTASLQVFATSQVQISAIKDSQGVTTSYQALSWNGEDGAMIITKYTIQEAQTKFGSLLTKQEAGTSKAPDRVMINYKDDGSLYSVDFQCVGKFENQPKPQDRLSAQATSDAQTGKQDIETKTGKPITEQAVAVPAKDAPVEPLNGQ